MMDLDGFKEVNDSLGHLAGDEVLRQVSVALQVVCGDFNAYCYGGDEFAVILPDADEEGARSIADRLRVAVVSSSTPQTHVTLSLGVATTTTDSATAEELT